MKVKKGLKIKNITVLDENIVKKDGIAYNLCKCECGKELLIRNHTLRTQRIRDCGCGTYKLKQYIGLKFGKLTIIDTYRKRLYGKINIICICQCDCGNIVEYAYSNLKNGNATSCGCSNKFNFSKYKGKIYHNIEILDLIDSEKKIVKCKCHCGSIFSCQLCDLTAKKQYIIGCKNCIPIKKNKNTKYYWNIYNNRNRIENIYYGIMSRCFNNKNKDFPLYGGRGITVCEEWKNNKKSFIDWAYANGYKDDLQIDRIDYNGNYEPKNCRWVNIIVQANNRSNNRIIKDNGVEYTLSEIAKKYNINYSTLCSRIRKGEDVLSSAKRPVKKGR